MKKSIENSNYTIDINGNVLNQQTKKLISKRINQKGYECFNLYIQKQCKNFKTHRLLAVSFIPNPNNLPCVNHKDGNKLNNNLSNLEWTTLSKNTKHAYDLGLIKKRFKFSKEIEDKIIVLHKEGLTQKQIALQFNSSQQTICNIIKRSHL